VRCALTRIQVLCRGGWMVARLVALHAVAPRRPDNSVFQMRCDTNTVMRAIPIWKSALFKTSAGNSFGANCRSSNGCDRHVHSKVRALEPVSCEFLARADELSHLIYWYVCLTTLARSGHGPNLRAHWADKDTGIEVPWQWPEEAS